MDKQQQRAPGGALNGMTGDAKYHGGRLGLGGWFSSSRPSAIDPTTPAPPSDVVSSPALYPPNTSVGDNTSRSGPYSGELYPPPESSGYAPQTSPSAYAPPAQGPPQGAALYPPPHARYVPNAPQNPLSGATHGLGQSFHQVADPMGPYTTGEPFYPPHEHGGMQHGGSSQSGELRAEYPFTWFKVALFFVGICAFWECNICLLFWLVLPELIETLEFN